jgi:hypothetical protein
MTSHLEDENKEKSPEMTVEEWLAIRKAASQNIDPNTAEIYWDWAEVLDPYGVLELAEENHCLERSYFARDPESDIWVSFYDLPQATLDGLQKKPYPKNKVLDLPF